MRRCAVFLLACVAAAEIYRAGPQVATFFSDVDDTDQPYALYIPLNLDTTKKYPLVVSLHGAASNHRLNMRRVFGRGNLDGETDPEATRYFPHLRDVPFIVVSPLARGTMGYRGIAEKDVYDAIADVKRRFHIDDDRVYLTGLSMGGGGTLWLGLTRPDLWAAIAPVCPAPPGGTEELAGNALNLPVKMFQGGADPVVNPQGTRHWQELFQRAGVKSEYIEYPGVRHNAWDRAYRNAAIFDWFAPYRRNRFPEHVHFSSKEYGYTHAYWVKLDAFTPGQLATVDARFTGRNAITIATDGLDAFTLDLGGHPLFRRTVPLAVTLDGRRLRVRTARALSFTRAANGWIQRQYRPSQGEKRPGVAGPMGGAIAARHVYVYGTGGSPTPAELKLRRDSALQAAEWSSPRSRLMVNFRVIADTELRDTDWKTSNLILFGSKETNMAVARLAPHMPAELNAGAPDYGLVMVVPSGDHLAVVNSGLPWWTRADQAQRLGLSFIPVPFRALETFGDFILFKGGLDNVVVEGRFDRYWKLPAEAAARMQATGAVTLR